MKELEKRIKGLTKKANVLKKESEGVGSIHLFWLGCELGNILGQITILKEFQERLKKGEIK